MTQPRSPTTTGKIERFHRSLRTEFLTGQVFKNLRQAQDALDEWVAYYNTERPHQSLGMDTPGARFGRTASSPAARANPVDDSALVPDRTGDDWVSRRVCSNGIVCVAWQQVSVGVHRAGEACDVHVTPDLLQFWIGPELVKTAARTTSGEVRKKRASVRKEA